MHIVPLAASSIDLPTIILASAAVIATLLFAQLYYLLTLRSLFRAGRKNDATEEARGEIVEAIISGKEADPKGFQRCLSLAQDNKTAIDNLREETRDLSAIIRAASADAKLMISEAELPALRSSAAAIASRVDMLHPAVSAINARTEESLSRATESTTEIRKLASDAAAARSALVSLDRRADDVINNLGNKILDLSANASAAKDELKLIIEQASSDFSALQTSIVDISAQMNKLQLTVSDAASKTADTLGKLTDGAAATSTALELLEKKVDARFDEWLHVNASWLATPYPSRFKFLLGEDVSYLFLTRGASVKAQPVCEQCSAIPDKEHPYNIQDVRLYFSEKM